MTQIEKQEIKVIANEVDAIKKDMAEMKKMIKDVHTLLAGNASFPNQHGLVQDYNTTKDKVETLEGDLKKYKAYFYALVTLVGLGILNFIKDLLGK